MTNRLKPERVGAYETVRPWHGLDDGWMRYGACNTGRLTVEEQEAFFADLDRGVAARALEQWAKRLCYGCLVRVDCLNYAIEGGMHGVWGGMNARERKVEIRRRRARVI